MSPLSFRDTFSIVGSGQRGHQETTGDGCNNDSDLEEYSSRQTHGYFRRLDLISGFHSYLLAKFNPYGCLQLTN